MGIGSNELSKGYAKEARKALEDLGSNQSDQLLRLQEGKLLDWQEVNTVGVKLGSGESKHFMGPKTLAYMGAVLALLAKHGIGEDDVLISYNSHGISHKTLYYGEKTGDTPADENVKVGGIVIELATLQKLRASIANKQRGGGIV